MTRIFSIAAAAGFALTLGFGAMPAFADGSSTVPPEATAISGDTGVPGGTGVSDTTGISDAGLSAAYLSEAAGRDLGLTPEEFEAAGELGKQAADVVAALRGVPGYLGIRIHDGKILVTGSGPELEAALAQLAEAAPAVALDAPPAVPGTELAASIEQLYQDYLRDVGPEGLQAVVTAGGNFVIKTGGLNVPESGPDSGTAYTTAAPTTNNGRMSPADFVSRYANVSLDDGARLVAEADLPGGLGYRADLWICSTGFSVFDPAGLPAVLTAGHCADDGAATSAILEFQGTPAGPLGQFGFSQFGGPGNSPVLRPANAQDPGNVGTDIAVIGDLREDLNPLPAASTWGAATEPDPDVKIIGTAAPVAGMPVCRSGRSSGWSCGTIDEVGIFVARGPDYATDPTDLRAFNGFLSYDVQSSGGDSGGPWVSGNYAVGTHSGGEDSPKPNEPLPVNFAVAATLQDSLAVLPGYELELFLNKPAVTSPAPGATFDGGQTIAGQVAAAPASAVAAGSKVRVTFPDEVTFDIPVDADGAWSFTAPDASGSLRFTAETVNGFSKSGPVEFEFAPVPVEVPVTPAREAPAPETMAPETPVPGPTTESTPVLNPYNPAPALVPASNGEVTAAGAAAVVVRPPGANLANTGASGVLLAAGLAALALVAGGVLLVLARRRKRATSSGS